MRKYRPSGRIPAGTVILLLLASAAIGAGLGVALYFVESQFGLYLVIAFPAIAGAIVGWILSLLARAGKARNVVIVWLAGAVGGLIIYGAYHAAGYYLGFRGVLRDAVIEQDGKAPADTELDSLIDAFLIAEVGEGGFVGYLRLVANEGFSITRTVSSSSSGIDLQGDVVFVYWAVEFLIAALVAAGLAIPPTREPFDEEADAWFGQPELIGTVPPQRRKDLLNALKVPDFHTVGSLLSTGGVKGPQLAVYVRRSGSVTAKDVYLFVQDLTGRRNRNVPIASGLLSNAELKMLQQVSPSSPFS